MSKKTLTTPLPSGAPFSAENISFGMIGLGDMGAGIATSIVRNGYDVVVSDLRQAAIDNMVAKGARAASSLEDLADQCEAVMLVVLDDQQVNTVVGKLFEHPGKLKTIIVSSTVLPVTVIALREKAVALGLELIDAPVSGGAEKASRGIITVLVGGADEAVRQAWPVLEAFGKHIFHLGPVGAGTAGKLVNNLLSLGGNILQLEAMQLADAYGITEDSVTDFVSTSAGDSRALRTWGRIERARRGHTLAGTPALYDAFSKDVKEAAIAAGQRGVTLPIAAAIGASMSEKMKARDALLEKRGLTGPLLQCRICGQELAAPFRKEGVHPECVYEHGNPPG